MKQLTFVIFPFCVCFSPSYQIERETKAVIGGKNLSAERSSGGAGISSGGPTVAVVSLVLALRGDQLKRLGLDRSVNSVSGTQNSLRRKEKCWKCLIQSRGEPGCSPFR